MLNLILILVVAVFAILAGAALLGAGAFVVASLNRWRLARNAGILARRTEHAARTKGLVALDDPTPDDLMVVADAVAEPVRSLGCIWPRCTTGTALCTPDEPTCEPTPTLHEERIPVPARPNALGGWVRIGDERVHRSCEQAYPAGLVCKYCLPILLVHARSVTS